MVMKSEKEIRAEIDRVKESEELPKNRQLGDKKSRIWTLEWVLGED
ncbi:hypothetical protein SDC9_07474 [bioreactor metagenome]|uniref:Uncharacterized protein n=1 Tax=bioreactor metagenome TaxID=1076179 RepID=A0A644T4N0_9ZZZZ|nr:hypothetical protein [Methanobrevibacter sp.]MEA4956929.1 hypothetical protein [Methanobrevibacter sp.]